MDGKGRGRFGWRFIGRFGAFFRFSRFKRRERGLGDLHQLLKAGDLGIVRGSEMGRGRGGRREFVCASVYACLRVRKCVCVCVYILWAVCNSRFPSFANERATCRTLAHFTTQQKVSEPKAPIPFTSYQLPLLPFDSHIPPPASTSPYLRRQLSMPLLPVLQGLRTFLGLIVRHVALQAVLALCRLIAIFWWLCSFQGNKLLLYGSEFDSERIVGLGFTGSGWLGREKIVVS